MTAGAYGKDCGVKWCDETGNHTEHRRYLFSLPAWRRAWVVGVNIAQPAGRDTRMEMTIMPRRGAGITMPLVSGEAEAIGDALLAASKGLPTYPPKPQRSGKE